MPRIRGLIVVIVIVSIVDNLCATPDDKVASDGFPRSNSSVRATPLGSAAAEDEHLLNTQSAKRRSTATSGSDSSDSGVGLPPCAGELRDSAHGCWLHDYVDWHRANRGKLGAKYLIWICYGPGGPGATRARTANVYGDNCAGLGDRMRGIQYLTRVAAATKRVLLVYQESPAPMERFLYPALIDWRLTPDLGLDPEVDVVKLAKHYRISSSGRNRLRDDISSGAFQDLDERVVTVSTNRPAHTGGSGIIPRMSPNGTAVGALARALFRLSPEVEKATDDALAALGIQPGQHYVAAHLRLGGLSGEQFLLGRFSRDPPQILAAAAVCAANLTAAYGMQSSAATAAAAVAMPHVLVTDNDDLRQHVAAGKLQPWITPALHPAHFMMSSLPQPEPGQQPGQRRGGREQERRYGKAQSMEEHDGEQDGERRRAWRRTLAGEGRLRRRRDVGGGGVRGTGGVQKKPSRVQTAALEELAQQQVLNMADLGILMRASCVLISPSGFSIQAHLLSDQRCAMRLQDCPGAT